MHKARKRLYFACMLSLLGQSTVFVFVEALIEHQATPQVHIL